MRARLTLLLLLTGAAPVPEAVIHHATGRFVVQIVPEAQAAASDTAPPTSRRAMTKTFTGDLIGDAQGTMLAAGTPAPGQPAAYVALDTVRGTLDGRSGGFVLLHRGTIDRSGASELSVTIAPDSGTGALAGIAGTLTIDQSHGDHRYDLAYTLPATH